MRQEEIDEIKHPSRQVTIEDFLSSGFKTYLQEWRDSIEKAYKEASTEAERVDLQKSMDARRHPDTIVGFLSKEQAWALTRSPEEKMLIRHGVTVISDRKAFFFTDDSQLGYKVLPREFIPCTFKLPLGTAHRTFSNIEEFCDLFCKGERYLSTPQEVVDYVNEAYYSGY